MTKDYENDYELLYMISENDEDANSEIFKKYEPVITKYARKYEKLVEGKGIDYNDLFQEGLIGLNSAINNYKNQKNIKFSTFAFMCIERKILSAVKKVNRKKHSILNESFSIHYQLSDEKSEFEDILPYDKSGIEDILVMNENKELFLEKINSTLSKLEKKVYELRLRGYTQEEMALELNKSLKSIESALFRMKIKIKKILNEIN